MTVRTPPAAIDAEQNILGALMLVPDRLDDVRELLQPESFFRRDHQIIFRAICELSDAKKPFDAVTLGDWFDRNKLAEQVGGSGYIIDLANTQGSASNIAHYAQIVRDKATLRTIIEIGSNAVSDALDGGMDAGELVADVQAKLAGIDGPMRGGPVPASDGLIDLIDELDARYTSGNRITGIPTPWSDVNEATHGFQPSELTIIAGRPSMGKSIAGLQVAVFTALRGKRVALFSLEMSRKQCNRRAISFLGGVPHDWLLAPNNCDDSESYWTRVTGAVSDLRRADLMIDETPSLTRQAMASRARKLNRRKKLDLIVVDHIHDFSVNPDRIAYERGAIAQTGKDLAKEFGIPVVMLAQLNRRVATASEKRPTLADIRESGEIEQKGDLILFLHREDYYDKNTSMNGVVEVILAKGRDLEAGKTIHLKNRYDQMRLEDWEGPLPSSVVEIGAPRRRFGGQR